MKLGEAVYKAQQAANDGSAEGGANTDAKADGGDGKVVDADYEEVSDDEKSKKKKKKA